MAVYTYDVDADVLYVLLVEEPEAAISRTDEVGPNLHVDLDADGRVVGIEFLYARARRGHRHDSPRRGIEHGAELCSLDPDFSRFPGLRWLDPLA